MLQTPYLRHGCKSLLFLRQNGREVPELYRCRSRFQEDVLQRNGEMYGSFHTWWFRLHGQRWKLHAAWDFHQDNTALPFFDDDFILPEINVLYAQDYGFGNSHSGSIHEFCNQILIIGNFQGKLAVDFFDFYFIATPYI